MLCNAAAVKVEPRTAEEPEAERIVIIAPQISSSSTSYPSSSSSSTSGMITDQVPWIISIKISSAIGNCDYSVWALYAQHQHHHQQQHHHHCHHHHHHHHHNHHHHKNNFQRHQQELLLVCLCFICPTVPSSPLNSITS